MISNIALGALSRCERMVIYSRLNCGVLNMDAVFSDGTANYVIPVEPARGDCVTIRIRAARDNVDRVKIHMTSGGSLAGEGQDQANLETTYEMQKSGSDEIFDYYGHGFQMISDRISYFFSIEKNGKIYYYNRRGLYYDLDPNHNFTVLAGFKTPDWAKGAIYYQIFIDRFYNGDKTNDVVNNEYAYLGKGAKHIDNWYQDVSTDDVCNFYGGDIKGIMDKMQYLSELGVEVLYLNPPFVSPSNHKYDIQDYDCIDPHYGVITEDGGEPLYFEKFHNRYATKYIQRTTKAVNLKASNELMAELISIAHRNGIKVILDGVFNHCGAFNKWLDKEGFYYAGGYGAGAYRDEKSAYHDYFRWYDRNWPGNDCYDGWWGHDNHPKLYYEASEELYNYMMGVAKKWVSPPFYADGWRLDVAADLGYSREFNHRFWRDFRRVVKEANPDAIIFAEHYGDPLEWLQGDQWDSVMNYDAFMEPITWFLTGMEKHSEEFRGDMLCNAMAFEGSMRYSMSRLSVQSLHTAMNQLSNHDHSRFLTRTNMTPGRLHTKGARAAEEGLKKNIMMEAVVFQFTWPGSPAIYYGDEVGMSGWTDPDNRRTYPWGREDKVLLSLHREMIRIHKTYKSLRNGSVEFLHSQYGLLSYGRWNADEKIVVVLNNNSGPEDVAIPVWKLGACHGKMKKLLTTADGGFSIAEEIYNVVDGFVHMIMPAGSSIVLLTVGN